MITSLIRNLRFILSHPIGRRHRMAVLGRWLRWQWGSRVLPYPIAVPFIDKTRLVQARGDTGSTGNYYVGLHEFYDMSILLHFLRPQDLFLDIGANVGSYSLLAGGVVGAPCHTFEPVPATYDRLTRNIRFNRIENKVETHCLALGPHPGRIAFTADLDSMNRVADQNFTGKTIDVPIARLDSIVHVADSIEAIMWKVDVEGFESQVLSGSGTLLDDSRVKIVLLEADNQDIADFMTNKGFSKAFYDPFRHELNRNNEKNHSHNNQIWVRDVDFVKQRLATAAKYRVFGEEI